jgi:hypothetical protein
MHPIIYEMLATQRANDLYREAASGHQLARGGAATPKPANALRGWIDRLRSVRRRAALDVARPTGDLGST